MADPRDASAELKDIDHTTWALHDAAFVPIHYHPGRILNNAPDLAGSNPKKATWRSLRPSCATWMIEAGAKPKDVQGKMRHSRIGTTMDIYVQFVPESQRRAVAKMMEMVTARRVSAEQAQGATIN